MGEQELSRPFRGESGGAYLRPKALLFVHCKENRRRLAVSGGHGFFVLLLVKATRDRFITIGQGTGMQRMEMLYNFGKKDGQT